MRNSTIKIHTQNNKCLPPYGIIISYEGLANPILESQVLEHADELTRNGIRTEVWFLNGRRRLYDQSQSRLKILQPKHCTRIRLLRSVWHNLPISEYCNAFIINYYLNKFDFSPLWIQARTEYIGAVCAALKYFRDFKFILDLRGDTLSEIALAKKSEPLIQKIYITTKFYLERWRQIKACEKAEAAIFVSKALQRMHKKNKFIVPCIIIPCVANPSLFYYDHTKRLDMRVKLGYSESNIVICYSGSTAIWQCANETIKMICELMKASSSVRAIILSKEKDKFEKLVEASLLKNFIFVSAEFEEVNSYLNAADFAVLLRERNAVNYVASPVKFAEYSMTGLQVITTSAVEQVVHYGSIIENILLFDNRLEMTELLKRLFVNEGSHRKLVSLAAQKYYSRKSYMEKCLSFYNVQ